MISSAYEMNPSSHGSIERRPIARHYRSGLLRMVLITLTVHKSVRIFALHAGHTECENRYSAGYAYPQFWHPDCLVFIDRPIRIICLAYCIRMDCTNRFDACLQRIGIAKVVT